MTRFNTLHGQSGAEVVKTLDDDGNEIVKITPTQRRTTGPVLLTPPDRVGQNPRLAHLPDPSVIEETDAGDLPVRGEMANAPSTSTPGPGQAPAAPAWSSSSAVWA
jgi:hypothetical protein